MYKSFLAYGLHKKMGRSQIWPMDHSLLTTALNLNTFDPGALSKSNYFRYFQYL